MFCKMSYGSDKIATLTKNLKHHVANVSFRALSNMYEHVYMRPEVNSNRFEISNRFERLFHLHDDFTAATFQPTVRL